MADGIRQTSHRTLRIETSSEHTQPGASQGHPFDSNDAVGQRARGRSLLRGRQGQEAQLQPRADTDATNDTGLTHDGFSNLSLGINRHNLPKQSYIFGESRHPLLQATVDELAEEGLDQEDMTASITSIYSESSFVAPAQSLAHEYSLSTTTSHPPSPPTEINSSVGARQIGTPRVKSIRRPRRSSIRSSGSLGSPASAFLSQFKRDSEPPTPIEPDDQGQIIGSNGEYVIGEKIGFGGFGVVKEVFTIEKDRKILRAVKIVRKQVKGRTAQENDTVQNGFEHEVNIWQYLKHPFILPLISVYENAFATFCITKLNTGGTLFDLVRSTRRPASSFATLSNVTSNESELILRRSRGIALTSVKRYAYQLAAAIRYLHNDMHIVHRDIKLENCLLDTSSTSGNNIGGTVLLCDFGMADFIRRSDRNPATHLPAHNIGPSTTSTSINGSLQYASPELIEAREPIYSPPVDIWAFGVGVFALLAGELPFHHPLLPKLQNMILEGHWDEERFKRGLYEREELEDLEDDEAEEEVEKAVDFIKGCLMKDSKRRWNIRRVLESAFLEGCQEDIEGL